MTKVALSVAEKPSVAKELANILSKGRAQRRQGSTPYNAIFEFPCEVNGEQYNMKVTSVAGHLMELDFADPYKGWNSCPFRDLFTLPVEKFVPKDKMPLYEQLKREAKRASLLILWLDCDLEGENIAFEVASACLESNPRLQVLRATFSALIPRDIFRALRNLHPPDERLAQAVDARQEIDLRLGVAFTRFQTTRLRDKYEGLSDIISYGPCQFPTLGFVVERYNKIQAFQAENFWSLRVEYEAPDRDSKDGVARASFSWKRGCLFDRLACLILFEMCLEDPVARVVNINARGTTRAKPVPLATVELQKRASRFLHMASERTMAVAEELYQRGIISYPRTETEVFSEGFDLIGMIQEHANHAHWGGFATRLLNGDFEKPRAGQHDDKAHPPIHPTKCVDLESLNEEQRKVYELVVRHFLACCSKDAKGFQTTVTIDVAGEEFSTTGLMVLERNWYDVYRYEHWSGTNIPCFQEGQTFMPKSIEMTEGRTHPPPLLSEADLIAEMDRNGIGTDATIAEHIQKIQVRQYAVKDESSRFKPTPLGLALVEAYNNMGYQLNKPYIRASMELETKRIARGELDKETMVRNCLEQMQQCFDTVTREAKKLDDAVGRYFAKHGQGEDYKVLQRGMVRCGHCRRGMDLKHKRIAGRRKADPKEQPRFLYCEECQVAHMMPRTGVLEPADLTCPLCSFQVVRVLPGEGYDRREYTICPFCYNNGGGDAEGTMPCYRCSADCPLAGRTNDSAAICACSACGSGRITIRKTPKGDFVAGCSAFPACKNSVWLPKAIVSISVAVGEQCARCSEHAGDAVFKAKVQYVRSLVPPGTPLEQTCCVCCDPLWREMGWNRVRPPQNAAGTAAAAAAAAAPHDVASAGTAWQRRPHSAAENIPPAHNILPQAAAAGTVDYMGALRGEGFGSRAGGRQTGTQKRGRGNAAAGGSTAQAGPVAARRGGASGAAATAPGDGGTAPMCECGLQAVVRTVNKESQNKGRQFFACPKNRDEGCGFFAWCDEAAGASRPAGRGGNQSAVRARSNAGEAPPPPGGIVCFKCQQPGHFARQCPSDPAAKRQRH